MDIVQRNQELRIGIVTQVDPVNHFVTIKDQHGSTIRITLHLHDGLTTILPKPGERWMVERRGSDWLLTRRMDDGIQPMPITKMQPGDGQISSSNNTYIIAPVAVILSGSSTHIYNLNIKSGFTIQETSFIRGHISTTQEIDYFNYLSSGVDTNNRLILPGVMPSNTPSISGGNYLEVPITMLGVQLGDNVYASPLSFPGSGIVWSARVVDDDIVAITIANTTSSGISFEKIKWAIDVWQH